KASLIGVVIFAASAWGLSQASYAGAGLLMALSLGFGVGLRSQAYDSHQESLQGWALACSGVAALTLGRIVAGRDVVLITGAGAIVIQAALATFASSVPLARVQGEEWKRADAATPSPRRSLALSVLACIVTALLIAYVGATSPRASWFGALVSHGSRDQNFVA